MFALTSQRSKTNQKFTEVCIGLIGVLIVSQIYVFFTGDIHRLLNGYDDCGNICGRKNIDKSINAINSGRCKAEDMTELSFTKLGKAVKVNDKSTEYHHGQCVQKCEVGYYNFANRCFKKSGIIPDPTQPDIDDIDLTLIISKYKHAISLSIACSAAFSFMMLVLYRYAIKQIIWTLYIGITAIFLIICVGCAIVTIHSSLTDRKMFVAYGAVLIPFAVVFGILGLAMLFFLLNFRDRIRLVIEIFREASKVLADIPLLLFEPFLTFFSLVLKAMIFIYFSMIIMSSGSLVELRKHGEFELAYYDIGTEGLVILTFNLFIAFWLSQFILGCQHFIIASTVSQWYFTRDKTKLESPLKRAFSHLFNFHIGTICLGSFLITIIKIILGIIRAGVAILEKSRNCLIRKFGKYLRLLLQLLERLCEFIFRNAYIVVALKGTDMFTSGRKAMSLLKSNLMNVVILNKLGDGVMVATKIFVSLMTGILCLNLIPDEHGMGSGYAPAIFSAIVAYFIIHCFMTVFEMAVDTIFICFCVDIEENSGTPEGFYMSPEMLQIIRSIQENSEGNFGFIPIAMTV